MEDYYNRIGLALEFIERRLTEPIQVKDISQAAFSSQWHFQRIFNFMTGRTLAEYLRLRRLSEAALEITERKRKVIDVALKYGYNSPESFSRAFKKEYGFNPRQTAGQSEFQITEPLDMKEIEHYNRAITNANVVEKTVFRDELLICGVSHTSTIENNRNVTEIPSYWGDFLERGTQEQIAHRMDERTLLGVYTNWSYDENFHITIGAEVSQADGNERFRTIRIPAQKYMVFTVKGPTSEDLWAGWKYIYGAWLPNTGRVRADGIDFDLFDHRFTGQPDSYSDIYIPIA